MNKLVKTIGLIFALLIVKAEVFAAELGDKGVDITLPQGGDILPGAGLFSPGEDVRTSFLFSKFIPFLITYTIRLAVGLAVIALIIGGYQFVTSYGDTDKRQGAQKTITYALIGLAVALTAFGIVTIITNINFGA